ncbi:MAG: S4 domain-containing protein [Candidatus Krumholzibacteria bacterium]
MRIDLALKYLCLAKSRSGVKTLCERSAITVNTRPAKASSTIHVGDRISIGSPSGTLTIQLLDVPRKQLSKTLAPSYYEVIEDYSPPSAEHRPLD